MQRGTQIEQDAAAAARGYSTDALLAFVDGFVATARDPETPEAIRLLAEDRMRGVRTELMRRERVARISADVATPADRLYEEWRRLAQAVRGHADMLRVLDLCGYAVHDATRKEAHAACPVCGGRDRLVITAGPPDLCWCRQCAWGGDVITLAMSLRQAEFRDAVTWLARMVGAERAAA